MDASYQMGDIVFCREAVLNDGGFPGVAADAELAAAGSRGVVVQVGYSEFDDQLALYLVRFEDAAGELGPPIGCYPDELTQDQPVVV